MCPVLTLTLLGDTVSYLMVLSSQTGGETVVSRSSHGARGYNAATQRPWVLQPNILEGPGPALLTQLVRERCAFPHGACGAPWAGLSLGGSQSSQDGSPLLTKGSGRGVASEPHPPPLQPKVGRAGLSVAGDSPRSPREVWPLGPPCLQVPRQ